MKAYDFALAVRGTRVPAGPDWFHEIKFDGYRMQVIREGDRVCLITKGGLDWTKRYPWIVETALQLRQSRFVIDGEAVVLGKGGISDFDRLHSGKYNADVRLYAFDMLAGEGNDMRKLPLSMRKTSLAGLLRGGTEGLFAAPFDVGAVGPDLFEAACRMGLEGLVSKDSTRSYTAGRCSHWIKVKNPAHPAMKRVEDSFRAKGDRAA